MTGTGLNAGSNIGRVSSIPARLGFYPRLAREILARYGVDVRHDPVTLPDYIAVQASADLPDLTVYLPNRRSCRMLVAACLEACDGKPLLLPRMIPVGDLAPEDLLPLTTDVQNAFDMPQPMAPLRRVALLSRLIGARSPDLPLDQQYRLAQDLAAWMDQIYSAGRDPAEVARLLPEQQLAQAIAAETLTDLSFHWQEILEFLSIVTETWPAILAEEGASDPAHYRRELMLAKARKLSELAGDPLVSPVMMAGMVGIQPAIAALMTAIYKRPTGDIILQAVDTTMAPNFWQALTQEDKPETGHPSYAVAKTLEVLGVDRTQVAILNETATVSVAQETANAREQGLSYALLPPSAMQTWEGARIEPEKVVDGMTLIRADDPQEEATAIAVALRHSLEVAGQTAVLITPDRSLGRMVTSKLRRWDVDVDDSGGTPLPETRHGRFLMLLARLIQDASATEQGSGGQAQSLLAVLRDPLVRMGWPRASYQEALSMLEQVAFRGLVMQDIFCDVSRRLQEAEARLSSPVAPKTLQEATQLWQQLQEVLAPIWSGETRSKKAMTWPEFLHDYLCCAEALVAPKPEDGHADSEPEMDADQLENMDLRTILSERGAKHLWRFDDGEAAAKALADLGTQSAIFSEPKPASAWVGLVMAHLQSIDVRPRFGQHPRLQILSPIEARGITADVMILGGLNEGVWPQPPSHDPWMSIPMRRAMGLAPPEQTMGLSAFDVMCAMAQPKVIATYAVEREGAPALPSRWLSRLNAFLGQKLYDSDYGVKHDDFKPSDALWHMAQTPATPYLAWARHMDARAEETDRLDLPPVKPAPPITRRPMKLSVTRLETYQNAPYLFFVESVLKLREWDALDMNFGPREWGNLIHKMLETTCLWLFNNADDVRDRARNEAGYTKILTDKMLAQADQHLASYRLSNAQQKAYLWQVETLFPVILESDIFPTLSELSTWRVEVEKTWSSVIDITAQKTTQVSDLKSFNLYGKADYIRLDTMKKTTTVIDYKTGSVPKKKDLESFNALQIPVQVWAQKKSQQSASTDQLYYGTYLPLKRVDKISSKSNESKPVTWEMNAHQTTALEAHLQTMLGTYLDPSSTMPAREGDTLYAVAHMARLHGAYATASDDDDEAES